MIEKSFKCNINFPNAAVENSHWQELSIETKGIVEDFNSFFQMKAAQCLPNQHFQLLIYRKVHSLRMITMFHCTIYQLEITESKHTQKHGRKKNSLPRIGSIP